MITRLINRLSHDHDRYDPFCGHVFLDKLESIMESSRTAGYIAASLGLRRRSSVILQQSPMPGVTPLGRESGQAELALFKIGRGAVRAGRYTRCQQSPAIMCTTPVVGKGLSDQPA